MSVEMYHGERSKESFQLNMKYIQNGNSLQIKRSFGWFVKESEVQFITSCLV
ncbi:hypothetical protein OC624_18895 [Bacillus altitudinis]|uniref:hypothetical protein n=1 Tax=Bacillus altitudinis TaxID=293387 RepID=UPI0015B9D80F|nr:hypothetical protein [Bacillus altitudinis]